MDLSTLIPVVATAGTLGVLHGIEPDHAAGIASMTSDAGDSKRSALLGACFAIGHVFLVVIWVALAYALLDMASVSQTFDLVGPIVVGILLLVLSGVLAITGLRKLVHTHEHHHDGTGHTHLHLHLPRWLPFAAPHVGSAHQHDHSLRTYLTIGAVGALFTLSPPVSMLAFISAVVPSTTGSMVMLAVLAYALTIVSTMAAIGGGIGTLFKRLRGRSQVVHAASQVIAAAVVFVFATTLLWGALFV